MIPVENAEEISSLVRDIRSGATGFTTNFFASGDQCEYWVKKGVLFYRTSPGCVLLFRRDRDFHHLYHCATDASALAGALTSLEPVPGEALAADLVDREATVQTLAGMYEACGFTRHTALFRMARVAEPAGDDAPADPEVVFADKADAPSILVFLERRLDRFFEQIPDLDEIAAAAARQEILLVRRESKVGGVLFFEPHGQTVVVRYWWIDEAFREMGIGSRLMKETFRLSRSARRIMAWVVVNNSKAIVRYEHYGFRSDGLVDQIMIKRRSA